MKKRILKTLFLGMFAFFTLSSFAQSKVSGIVKSEDGELLPGVSIVIKGATQALDYNS